VKTTPIEPTPAEQVGFEGGSTCPVTAYGSYEPWPNLLAHHQEDFNSWLKRFYSSNEPNVQFRDAPEILPEWNLRLNVQADGKGYVLLLNDPSDKTGFAWVSDESGIIRECNTIEVATSAPRARELS
jgi:hypothetical protein